MDRARRNFLRNLSLIMASVAGFFAFISLFRFSLPRSSGLNKRVKIGKPGLFPLNDYTYIPEHKLFIYRDNAGVKVISSICTHLGCAIEKTEDGFQCPCHGSHYDRKGHVLSGPALKDLPWYRLYRSMEGQIIVDLTKTVDPDYKLTVF